MLVISRQAPAPMDPDTHIRNVTVDQQLANIRPATYLPQLNSRRMGEYGDLRHRKMLTELQTWVAIWRQKV
jgi:hypothetical protein